jgi:hypothetical protein
MVYSALNAEPTQAEKEGLPEGIGASIDKVTMVENYYPTELNSTLHKKSWLDDTEEKIYLDVIYGSMRLTVTYTAKDWIFAEGVIAASGDERRTFSGSYDRKVNDDATVHEVVTCPLSKSDAEYLARCDSLALTGKMHTDLYTLSEEQKSAIKTFVEWYDKKW